MHNCSLTLSNFNSRIGTGLNLLGSLKKGSKFHLLSFQSLLLSSNILSVHEEDSLPVTAPHKLWPLEGPDRTVPSCLASSFILIFTEDPLSADKANCFIVLTLSASYSARKLAASNTCTGIHRPSYYSRKPESSFRARSLLTGKSIKKISF